MDAKTIIPLGITVLLALAGYAATYLNGLRLSQRKDQLDRVERQLRDLYGPLYALTECSGKSWHAFREQVDRPFGPFWSATEPPSEKERAAWCLWMQFVLMPLNLRIEAAIVEHADLLQGKEMPECLLQLLAHIASYKAVLKSWELGDFSRYFAILDYPVEANAYIARAYLGLKARQQQLIGEAGAANR
jgi:hypothetical protein